MNEFDAPEDDPRDLVARFRYIYIILGLTLVIIFSRLWYLQIIQGDELHEYSEKNLLKETRIRAPRGLILDRDGNILVDNVLGFNATITPQYASRLVDTANVVGKILQVEPEKIIEDVRASRWKNGPFMPVIIKPNLTLDEVFRLKRIRIDQPGLNVDETVMRYYPLGPNGAQLFGYVGEVSQHEIEDYRKKYHTTKIVQQGDWIGQNGLEESLDPILRGHDGLSYTEVDAHGRESAALNKALLDLKPQPPVPGHNIVLTIDEDVQKAAMDAMLHQNDKIGPRIGALVAIKSDGEILAWVSTPSFDPNEFAQGSVNSDTWDALTKDPYKPFMDKVIQDHYSPGSTIKPVVATAALQEGVVTPYTIVSAPGKMWFGGRWYHDAERAGHGNIDIMQAIEESSNVFFYKMGIQLGIDNIAKYAKAMGLGQKTGIQVPGETPGLFPTKAWKMKTLDEPWLPGENLSNAIGQGYVLVTLLQEALAYNTIATNGTLYKPFLVKEIQNQNHHAMQEYKPQIIRDITKPNDAGVLVNKKYLAFVREGMRLVANGDKGTAHWWKIPGVIMAGKTGTSQVVSFSADQIHKNCFNRPFWLRDNGIYLAFAPVDHPEIVVGVLAEHSCWGNLGGAPVVRDVIRAYIQKYHPDWIKTKTLVGKSRPTKPILTETRITHGD